MKISREWLQTYFDAPLPAVEELARALTFHAFEIDGLEKHQDDDVLDVKVTPNRGHDALCHWGIAKELSAILSLPLAHEVSSSSADPALKVGASASLSVSINSPLCSRYMATRVRGVTVGPSPTWLVKRLEAIGQRSINNIVDATNYAMFSFGQPLHAFDARTLAHGDAYVVGVRPARSGEELTALDGKQYMLNETTMVIAGGADDRALGIAGVKGGRDSGVSDTTTELIIEAATFDGVSVRKTSRTLDLRTDASSRFEQQLSPSLVPRGMLACIELIREIAGGEIIGTVDVYPLPQEEHALSVSLDEASKLLGISVTEAQVRDVFTRLRLPHEYANETFSITAPSERLDLAIREDLVEEIGRLIGYDTIPAVELSPLSTEPAVNAQWATMESVRAELIAKGYSEVYTSVFAEKGDRAVLNKVGGDRPYLRTSLVPALTAAQKKNAEHKELLELAEIKLFEIGTVWKGQEEVLMVGTADAAVIEKPLSTFSAAASYSPMPFTQAEKYQPFSRYPYIVRDIALWVPTGTESSSVLELIRAHSGDLLVRSYQFDSFVKGERTSFAFRLVFQSPDRTLFDEDAASRMQAVVAAVTKAGYEVR